MYRPYVFPVLVIALCRDTVEVQVNAFGFQVGNGFRTEHSPRLNRLENFLFRILLRLEFFKTCKGAECVPGLAAVYGACSRSLLYFAVHRLFAVVNGFKKRNRMIHFEDFLKLHGGLFTHRLGGAAYVHHSKLLKLLQEFLTLPAEENEGVFHHFVNHSSAPPLLLQ